LPHLPFFISRELDPAGHRGVWHHSLLGARMSRTVVGGLFLLYFAAMFAFSIFLELQHPLTDLENTYFVWHAFGRTLPHYAISGILPVVFWAGRRFRVDDVNGPLIAWAFLALVYGVYEGLENQLGVDAEYRQLTNFALSAKERNNFLRSSKTACMGIQRNDATNQKIGVTEEQINAYCECYANNIIKVVTAYELRSVATGGKPAPSFQAKVERVTPTCLNVAFSK
jgi:hypothetical protein